MSCLFLSKVTLQSCLFSDSHWVVFLFVPTWTLETNWLQTILIAPERECSIHTMKQLLVKSYMERYFETSVCSLLLHFQSETGLAKLQISWKECSICLLKYSSIYFLN